MADSSQVATFSKNFEGLLNEQLIEFRSVVFAEYRRQVEFLFKSVSQGDWALQALGSTCEIEGEKATCSQVSTWQKKSRGSGREAWSQESLNSPISGQKVNSRQEGTSNFNCPDVDPGRGESGRIVDAVSMSSSYSMSPISVKDSSPLVATGRYPITSLAPIDNDSIASLNYPSTTIGSVGYGPQRATDREESIASAAVYRQISNNSSNGGDNQGQPKVPFATPKGKHFFGTDARSAYPDGQTMQDTLRGQVDRATTMPAPAHPMPPTTVPASDLRQTSSPSRVCPEPPPMGSTLSDSKKKEQYKNIGSPDKILRKSSTTSILSTSYQFKRRESVKSVHTTMQAAIFALDAENSDPEDEEDTSFQALQLFFEGRRASRSNISKLPRSKTIDKWNEEHDEKYSAPSKLAKFVIKPDSLHHICWDLLGLLLIAYDCFMIPFESFEPADSHLIVFASWVLRVYWTLNMFTSFLTGYIDSEGAVVLQPAKIVKRYSVTWLPLDIFIVSADWLEAVVQGGKTDKYHRVGVAFRGVRMIRTVRLLRMAKLHTLLCHFTDQLRTEELLLMAHIIKIMAAIITAAHFIACVFYAIGTADKDYGWVEATFPQPLTQPLAERYFMSLHWSLSMFVGETLVEPQNLQERVFGVSILFLGFIITSFMMGSLTTAMTRLQLIRSEQSQQLAQLRRFLVHRAVSRPLAIRVQRNAQHMIMEQKRNMPEESVSLLALISEPLKVELHFEAYSGQLMTHPFFICFNEVNPVGMRKICHLAVSLQSYSIGDVLFSAEEEPTHPRMFFIISGRLEYVQEDQVKLVSASKWLCEGVLWTKWRHCGTIRAISETKTMVLHADRFHKVVSGIPSVHMHRYVEGYVQNLNAQEKHLLSDYGELDADIEEVLVYAFPELLDDQDDDSIDDLTSERRASSALFHGMVPNIERVKDHLGRRRIWRWWAHCSKLFCYTCTYSWWRNKFPAKRDSTSGIGVHHSSDRLSSRSVGKTTQEGHVPGAKLNALLHKVEAKKKQQRQFN